MHTYVLICLFIKDDLTFATGSESEEEDPQRDLEALGYKITTIYNHTYISLYLYPYLSVCIYIYIERERCVYIHLYVYLMCVYIYIYIYTK